MADKSLIEWTDTTWQIVTGCSIVSPGCTNCYAMRLAGGRMQNHPSRVGLTTESKAGPVWNGQVRFNEAWLTQPLGWKKPRKIFVAAHGDLFHEGVTDAQLDQIFAVMALCPQHVFQVLTKRPERMRSYVAAFCGGERNVFGAARVIAPGCPLDPLLPEGEDGDPWEIKPLPNVWLGVSVEDQARADERIPDLLDTPAAVHWISAEPLLGPVTFRWAKWDDHRDVGGELRRRVDHLDGLRMIDWVIVGGESGPGARPMHPDWARQIRDECAEAGVPFLFKQWGSWEPRDEWSPGPVHQRAIMPDGSPCRDDVAPQDVGAQRFVSVGKKAAGRHLDGVLHDGYPATGAGEGAPA